jgi:hypothetical protein
MGKLLIFVIAFSIPIQTLADWRVEERIDSMTDAVKKTAIVKNELGHTLFNLSYFQRWSSLG